VLNGILRRFIVVDVDAIRWVADSFIYSRIHIHKI
jgi:hypothetical protein